MDDPKMTLSEMLEFLTHRYQVPFTINDRAFQMENPDAPYIGKTEVAAASAIPPMKAPLGKVIARILARLTVPSGATFLVREDGIEITTGAFVAAEIPIERRQSGKALAAGGRARKKTSPAKPAANLPRPGKPGLGGGVPAAGGLPQGLGGGPGIGGGPQGIGGVMGIGESGIVNLEDKSFTVAVVSVAVQNQPLEEALRQIRSQANISLVLDPALGEKAQTPLTVTLLNAPVDSALQVLTAMVELDVVWLDNIFYLTTENKAQELRTSWPDRRSGGGAPRPQDSGPGMP
jgi:hypothetical protein